MKLKAYWEVEDTFFGAILGAILGTFVDRLPFQYVALIVFFFILFPMTLRKAEIYSRRALLPAFIPGSIWVILLFVDLGTQLIIPSQIGWVFIIIFLGWFMSLFMRIKSK